MEIKVLRVNDNSDSTIGLFYIDDVFQCFTIEDEVMESYPVQTTVKKILWNEQIITGKILSAGETAMLIKITEGFDSSMVQAHITEDTIFYNNIPALTEKGKTIGFTITGEILETEPPQVYVKRFVIYE